MPARTGQQYIDGLRAQEREVWLGGERVRYVDYIREHDVTLTHAVINLQRSRNPTGMFNLEEGTALEVKRETDAGIIVRGARILATLGPLSDEIAVYSPRLARHSEEHSP